MNKRIKPKEAAELIGVSPQAMQMWRANDRGPNYFKICGSVFYEVEEIERFIEASRVSTGEEMAEQQEGRADA